MRISAEAILTILCIGLGWMVYRLCLLAERQGELNMAIMKEIDRAGWFANYVEARNEALRRLAAKRFDQEISEREKPSALLFGKTKSVLLLITGAIGAALFFYGRGPYELLGLIAFFSAGILSWISLWFHLSEKESGNEQRSAN